MITAKENATTVEKKAWFEEWFDSDYYHILYKERDEKEAKNFIDNLKTVLQWQPHQTMLDLACGRGRHAHYLASLGLQVTGLDLSASSIEYAKNSFEYPVNFAVQDMRKPFGVQQYDYILNLFTSFGYFDNEAENVLVLSHIKNALKDNGTAVIEFMNPHFVVKHLKEKDTKQVDNIVFEMSKEIKGNFLYKHIRFKHNNTEHHFTEKLMLVYLEQFEKYFKIVGVDLQKVYGDYNLSPYDAAASPRMIMLIKKADQIMEN